MYNATYTCTPVYASSLELKSTKKVLLKKWQVGSAVSWSTVTTSPTRVSVHADASLTQVGERQMLNAAERGGRLCLFVARSALSLALQALNGTPQSEVTPHESCFCSCVQPAPTN
ncbi:hypothetical protein EVAR_75985_1 [Eumeta japonica]|uniref:Uncharacterized protein n=1 Tax=Eumeta variegata TaxID=151549 RepID=A0A4C1UA62_EUMVA|nr:hypothetical protein EVAR_75985_1 [Eumeta japonica]